MGAIVTAKLLRFLVNTRSYAAFNDVVTNAPPKTWGANNLRIEVGINNGPTVSDDNLLDLAGSEIQSLTLEVRANATATTNLMAKTVTVFDNTLDQASWNDGTKQHAVFEFTAAESNIPAGKGKSLAIWGTTTTGKIITFGRTNLEISADGANFDAGVPPTNPGAAISVDAADARYGRKLAVASLVTLGTGTTSTALATNSTGLIAAPASGTHTLTLPAPGDSAQDDAIHRIVNIASGTATVRVVNSSGTQLATFTADSQAAQLELEFVRNSTNWQDDGSKAYTGVSSGGSVTNPTVTITSSAPSVTNTSPIPVTMTFSESVTGFVVGEITVTNGTAGSFSGSGATYTANVTPSGQGAVTVSVAAGVANGATGTNQASNTLTRTYDSTAPSATLTPADNATNVLVGANLVMTFNENVTAQAAKNILLKKTSDNSTVATIAANNTGLVTVSGGTVTINPASDLDAGTEYYVQVDAGAFKDAAGNDSAAISSTTAWSFTTASASGSLPSTGLLFDLDAAPMSGSDNATITQFTDRSGLSNHATTSGSPLVTPKFHNTEGPGGGKCIKFANGKTVTGTLVAQPTANITTADTSGISAGDTVTGTGIAGGTTVSSVDSSTEITLSQAATAIGTSNLTFNGTITVSCERLAGPSAIVTMASTAGLVAGMVASSASIVGDPVTTIASVDSGTQVTLSADATASGSETIYFATPASELLTLADDAPVTNFHLFIHGKGGVDGVFLSSAAVSQILCSIFNNGANRFYFMPGGGADFLSGTASVDPTATFSVIEVERSGSTITVRQNGTALASGTTNGTPNASVTAARLGYALTGSIARIALYNAVQSGGTLTSIRTAFGL